MCKRLVYLSFMVLGLGLIPTNPAKAVDRVVVGQYPNYGTDELAIADINYEKLTHIIYFSLSPFANGNLDTTNVNLSDLQELVTYSNGIKTLICVGGWGRSTYFSAMAASPSARANFAANLKQYCLDYNLDGTDLDWEPVISETDKNNYSLLVEQVHNAFEPHGLILTVSVYAFGEDITPEAIGYVDWLNIMAYNDTPPNHSTFEFAVASLDYWESYGAPREKEVLGVPFYGKKANDTSYSYKFITDTYQPGPEVDYIAGIGFNGINTVKQKTEYVLNNCYRGIMIWEISQDTFDETSLLTAIWEASIPDLPADFDGNGCVDFLDFSVLGLAWQSEPNDNNWNPVCDISKPKDDIIDQNDLAVFCAYWQGCPYASDSPPDFDGDGHVDFVDFSVLAAAWQSDPDDDNWNEICDISTPSDNIINQLDLAVLCENWLRCLSYCNPNF
jgi:GH18 family chitinase